MFSISQGCFKGPQFSELHDFHPCYIYSLREPKRCSLTALQHKHAIYITETIIHSAVTPRYHRGLQLSGWVSVSSRTLWQARTPWSVSDRCLSGGISKEPSITAPPRTPFYTELLLAPSGSLPITTHAHKDSAVHRNFA